MWFSHFIVLFALVTGFELLAKEPLLATRAPAKIELHDQFGTNHVLRFPCTNTIFLTVADRKSSGQVKEWVSAIKKKCQKEVMICGIANIEGAPGFLHRSIRKKFEESFKYPVMMDWTGEISRELGVDPGVANILIVDREGKIHGRFKGEATEASVKQAAALLAEASQQEQK
ncbi:MAG: hypothetical protein SFY81_00515 [Verrucomicrobiota bacterium]|nr:hypothetical protein [Verrucomicrobiota bacterium]